MGPHFMNYNRHGLLIESFAKFGPELWRVLEDRIGGTESEPGKRSRRSWPTWAAIIIERKKA